jgi:colanic acid/amylovoran biosynthesis glycosyltransferase
MFPLVSETFVIDQVAGLLDRGVEVDVYSFSVGDEANVSQRYFDYDMRSRVTYLDYPLGKFSRFVRVWPRVWRLLVRQPRSLLHAVNVRRHGLWALSLKLLYWTEPLAGKRYDVVHCHFGTVARNFVHVRETAGLGATPLVTTFYGVDVSRVLASDGSHYYDELKDVCSLYFVMSEDMRRRVVEGGFPADRVCVHPVGVDLEAHPFHLRTIEDGQELSVLAVGRLIEKKGFDDLLRAIGLLRQQVARRLSCVIVGAGPLDSELRLLAQSLEIEDLVRFEGAQPVERVVELMHDAHVLVAPSKTAADGDME